MVWGPGGTGRQRCQAAAQAGRAVEGGWLWGGEKIVVSTASATNLAFAPSVWLVFQGEGQQLVLGDALGLLARHLPCQSKCLFQGLHGEAHTLRCQKKCEVHGSPSRVGDATVLCHGMQAGPIAREWLVERC